MLEPRISPRNEAAPQALSSEDRSSAPVVLVHDGQNRYQQSLYEIWKATLALTVDNGDIQFDYIHPKIGMS